MDQKQALQLFNDRQIRTAWDEKEEKWYFSIVDVVAVLTDSTDPKQYLKKMKARDPELESNWGTICTLVRMKGQDGNPTNFEQNKRVAKGGGHVAKIARAELEKQLGRSIVSPANAKGLKAPDEIKQIESGDSDDQ